MRRTNALLRFTSFRGALNPRVVVRRIAVPGSVSEVCATSLSRAKTVGSAASFRTKITQRPYSTHIDEVEEVDEESLPSDVEDDFDVAEIKAQAAEEEALLEQLPEEESDELYFGEKRATPAMQKLIENQRALVVPDHTHSVPHLPAPEQWRTAFAKTNYMRGEHRWFIANDKTCDSLVEALGLHNAPEAGRPKTTIIEGYPGPGVMTRSFLNAEGVEKVVALESNLIYAKGLENLQADESISKEARERLAIVPQSAFHWDTYRMMLESGTLDHLQNVRETRKTRAAYKGKKYFTDDIWTQPSPLLFFAQLPSTVHSEQLLSQILRSISHRLWLFRYGRVRLALMCSEQIAERLFAPPGSRLRGKLTMIAHAMGHIQMLKPKETFHPPSAHFYPPTLGVGPSLPLTKTSSTPQSARKKLLDTSTREEQCLVLIEPRVRPLIEGDELDAFDFVSKNLFILRSQPIRKGLASIAAGAENVLRQLDGRGHPALLDLGESIKIDPKAVPNELRLEEMVAIARMFDRWPFRPEHLFDEGNMADFKRETHGSEMSL